MTTAPTQGWTETTVSRLKELYEQGLSARQIAAGIGQGITRNAVIGKIHRLGLHLTEEARARNALNRQSNGATSRRRRSRAGRAGAGGALVIRPAMSRVQPFLDCNPDIEVVGVPKPGIEFRCVPIESRHDQCKHGFGDPQREDFRYCGAPTVSGRSFCAYHAAINYQPATRDNLARLEAVA